MTAFSLTRVDVFPDGTSVKLYPVSQWPNGHPSGVPAGSETASATVSSGSASFNVTAGDYYAYAQVGGVDRYISVSVGQDQAGSSKSVPAYIDTDGTLTANSDTKVPSQKAVRAYVAANGLTFPISYTGTATDDVVKSKVTGDAQQRFILNADGGMEWGAGSGATDTTLGRIGAKKLGMADPGGTSSGLAVGAAVFGRAASGNYGITFGDVTLDRRSAGSVRVSDGGATGWFEIGSGFLEGVEQASDPAAPSANQGRLFFKDNGSGKTQLAVRFPTGATQIVATEP